MNLKMDRKKFIGTLAAMPLMYSFMKLNKLENIGDNLPKTEKMPVLFIGHGHPINAIKNNSFTQTLNKLKSSIETPKAIMVISAHWETKGTFVSTNPSPKTIYDFGKFNDDLFKVKYEPKGHPELAQEIQKLGSAYQFNTDIEMGLDHGAWTVLKHIYPKADIPVFQMSMDYTKNAQHHFELAQSLKELRKKGVLIIGSGNITHNLGILNWQNEIAQPFDWAKEFDQTVKEQIEKRDFLSLVNYQKFGRIAEISIPTPDHYLPMIYSLGLADKDEPIEHFFEEIHYASISMRCFRIG